VARDESYTLAEAAELTGMTTRALARRIERGSLPATKRNGRRRVTLRALTEAGLIDPNTRERPAWSREGIDQAEVARELIATVIRQAIDLHDLRRAIEDVADASQRGHAEQEAAHEVARQERAELRQKIASMDEDRAELRRELEEARRELRRGK
jgi:DNA-binding transcriptional MerR regulator